MASACVVGSTGLVGSHILAALISHPAYSTVYAFSRKSLKLTNTKLKSIEESQSNTWPSKYPENIEVFFSALGTTARIAGSFQKQREIDYDLNIALAQAAFGKGTKIYVMISTSGADPTSRFPYTKMKGELDEAIKTIGFDHTIILQPGLLVGTREDSRPGEYAARSVARFLGSISGNRLTDSWAQDAAVVARAALAAAMEAKNGLNTDKVRVLGQRDIVRMGRGELQQTVE